MSVSDGSFANWRQASYDMSAPGNGTVTSYTNYVIGDYLHEAMWRNGKGYIRSIPINNDGL